MYTLQFRWPLSLVLGYVRISLGPIGEIASNVIIVNCYERLN